MFLILLVAVCVFQSPHFPQPHLHNVEPHSVFGPSMPFLIKCPYSLKGQNCLGIKKHSVMERESNLTGLTGRRIVKEAGMQWRATHTCKLSGCLGEQRIKSDELA